MWAGNLDVCMANYLEVNSFLLPDLGHMIHHSAPVDLIRAIEFTAH
jgi:hypothetical protein